LKILDRYILTSFVSNFVSAFIILMFIFIFQSIWLFIDDLAGKGLDIYIVGKFLLYLTPNLTEKVLPLTVLLSSILTFGNFAENYEFAAMKASGISLQKAMRSLIVFILFLAFITFYFANTVIPASEQKIYNLRKNISKVKPSAAIAEGVFSDIPETGMNMKVDKKYGEKDRFLEKIIIHEKKQINRNSALINTTVIKAKSGELISSLDSDILQLVLKDGHYYEKINPKNAKSKKKHPFVKAVFKTYTINTDLSGTNEVDLEAESNISTNKMKNVSRLVKDIDSLKKVNIKVVNAYSKNINSRMGAFYNPKKTKIELIEKGKAVVKRDTIKKDTIKNDSINKSLVTLIPIDSILDRCKEFKKMAIINGAKNTTSNILNSIKGKKDDLDRRYKIYNLHILSLHQKYALALGCVILFFVGAPLGAIIRKGGLGLPMVIAIILFLAYYFIGVFAQNYAKEGNIHPVLGAWLSTLIMLPLGVFLTVRATNDKGLINISGIIVDFFKKIFKKKQTNPST